MRIYANSRNLRIIIAILLKRKWQGALARWQEMSGKLAGKVRVSGKLDPIYAIEVLVPSIDEQRSFSAFVQQSDKSKYKSSQVMRPKIRP